MSMPNDLWIHGGVAMALPYTSRDAEGYPWDNLALNEDGRAACGFTKAPDWPDHDPALQDAVWADGAWVLVDKPPSPPAVVRVSKLEFQRLYTDAETVEWNKVKRRIAAMSEADYGDPANLLLIKAEIANQRYEAAKDYVELSDAETVAFVSQVQVGLEVVSAERAAQILANQPPPAG